MFTRECSIVHIGKSYTSAYIYMRACAFLLQSSTPGWSARLTAGNGFVTLSSLSFAPTRGIKCDARMGCFEKAAGLAPARENPTPHSSNKFTSRSFILGCRSLPPWSWRAGVYFTKSTLRNSSSTRPIIELANRLCGKTRVASINTDETQSSTRKGSTMNIVKSRGHSLKGSSVSWT